MDRWKGRVAVVTGASSGIGAAIVKDLLKADMIVVGLARRTERIEALANPNSPNSGKLYAIKCDFNIDNDICDAFNWIEENLKRIDILINNAGLTHSGFLILNDDSTDVNNLNKDKEVIQVNLWGPILCTKKAVSIMKKMNINDGHIIHMNSILGHRITTPKRPMPFNVYPSTKHGLTALTEVLRQELLFAGTKIKVTSISPGITRTEIMDAHLYDEFPHLNVEDISNAVLYVLGTPPHVQVHELTILPIGEFL